MSSEELEKQESERTPRPMKCALITASDTRTRADDTSGDLMETLLSQAGHTILSRSIVREDMSLMSSTLLDLLSDSEIEIILISGGTGVTRRDITPDVVQQHSTKEIVGFGELFRWLSYAQIGSSTIQSRACAHLCGEKLVFALPGSPRAVMLAMEEILIPQLDIRHKPCNFAQLLPRIRGE